METRVCRKCGLSKPITELKRTDGGRADTICKECFAKQQREWYDKNKEIVQLKGRIRRLERYASSIGVNLSITMEEPK